jgi:GDP/UDP-N,N'-diacetylbacillosamine 2-epimerase (hydrolysing)
MLMLKRNPAIELQLTVTGMHLSKFFGNTLQEILDDGFLVASAIHTLPDQLSAGEITRAVGQGLISGSQELERLNPDLVIVLGDRYETYAIASSAYMLGIPLGHIHGGELTQGSIDEGLRHSISKFASIHFTATEKSSKRVIQLGEQPESVFNVGSLGAENVSMMQIVKREELEARFGFIFGESTLVVSYHPATVNAQASRQELLNLLETLRKKSINLIVTYPNADALGDQFAILLQEFSTSRENCWLIPSMGHENFLSTIYHADGLIGNSSSGIIEVPSLARGTINIGNRQTGREAGPSVIHASGCIESIEAAIEMLFSATFKMSLDLTKNPYFKPNTAAEISKLILGFQPNLQGKTFFDL